MNYVITGGSGFVGTSLIRDLLERGHSVVATGTSASHSAICHEKLDYISADTTVGGEWQDRLQEADVLINLAGRNIFRLWTKKYRDQIYTSRILTTRNLVEALPKGRDVTLLNASAVGYYGNRGDDILGEDSVPGSDFAATVCVDWEKEASKAEALGARAVHMRFGVVLGRDGGALEKMLPAFRLCVGGPLGNGKHWFPWIHIEDVILAVHFLIDRPEMSGAVNFCAPGSVRQRDFAKALGRALNRPAFLRAPGFLIRLLLGEMGRSLISSQRATPDRLTENGFAFRHPEVDSALRDIILD